MRDIDVKPRDLREEGRNVTCRCGARFGQDSAEELDHYVWAVRRTAGFDVGKVSNLGDCPDLLGWDEAVRRARRVFGTNPAWYRGAIIRD